MKPTKSPPGSVEPGASYRRRRRNILPGNGGWIRVLHSGHASCSRWAHDHADEFLVHHALRHWPYMRFAPLKTAGNQDIQAIYRAPLPELAQFTAPLRVHFTRGPSAETLRQYLAEFHADPGDIADILQQLTRGETLRV